MIHEELSVINLILVKLHNQCRSDAPSQHDILCVKSGWLQVYREIEPFSPQGGPGGTQDGQGQGTLPLFTPLAVSAEMRQSLGD